MIALLGFDPETFLSEIVLNQSLPRGFVINGDRAFFDQAFEAFPSQGIAISRPIVEFVHAVRAGQIRKLDTDRLMLMLLGVAAEAFEPGIVLAHFLCPHLHHFFRYGVVATQRGEIGYRLVDGRGIEIALARDSRIATFLAFWGFFQNDDLGAQLVGVTAVATHAAPNPTTTKSASISQVSGCEDWYAMTYSCSCYLVIFGIDWVCMSRYCKTYRAFAQLV